MNTLTIERTNGNVPKKLAGEDHVSGFMAVLPSSHLPNDWMACKGCVHAVSSLEKAAEYGITADSESWHIRMVHYHLSEIFRTNPGISLYVCLIPHSPALPLSVIQNHIKDMQRHAGGRIRQLALWAGYREIGVVDIAALQQTADELDGEENAPLSILYAPLIKSITYLPTKDTIADCPRVSIVIAQDGGGRGAELYNDKDNDICKSYGEDNLFEGPISVTSIGTVLGLVSRAAVHESIGWVKKFPTGISVPAFGNGQLVRETDREVLEQLDTNRYLFFVTQVGQAGSYVNDSHTMADPRSDYAMIENVRTMDKAVRGVRAALIPELGGNIYTDAESGKLQPYSISHLETTANRALEDMEKAGELSGYRVEIDPDQDVLSTSTVEIVIRQVGVGVMRHISVKIGFAKTV